MGSRKRSKPRAPLPRMLFFDEAADRERSCTRKDGYPSESHARAIAAMNGRAEALSTYRCRYCDGWHLTSRREGNAIPTTPEED